MALAEEYSFLTGRHGDRVRDVRSGFLPGSLFLRCGLRIGERSRSDEEGQTDEDGSREQSSSHQAIVAQELLPKLQSSADASAINPSIHSSASRSRVASLAISRVLAFQVLLIAMVTLHLESP